MNDSQKLEFIFHAARELRSVEQRDIYLREACQGDHHLRTQVEELLQAAAEAEIVFQTGTLAEPTVFQERPIAEGPGTIIGRYKLLQQIGEGGMGLVYMAEQEEPIRRRVALKIIKLGMDTRQVVARFEAERQALALMDHPNIAKVFDGGATETGRPYFVMELVQGMPITEFCDKTKLPAKERLKLFIQVCQAIQSAHQKGIIHRDIKPSNVLVTLHDGVPVTKVIDFGIAKATSQKLTEKTLFTSFGNMIGTPAYMSPEQAELSGLDVDTRTDIYALGVLLYALLTGTTPFPEKRLRSLGYGEMQRVILEEEPERPSTRLNTMTREQKTVVARNCGAEIAALDDLLKGDLDWIAMKCLEKDRARRYESASSLANDIQRHLGNEPVSARPPSAGYRFQKMIRRNKGVALASAVIALTLFAALAFSTVAFWSERKARLEAAAAKRATESESIRADSLMQFMKGFFNDVIPELNTRGHREAIKRLLIAAEPLTLVLNNAPLAEAQLHFEIANAYGDLWDYKPSFSHFREAERIAEEIGAAWLKNAACFNRIATEMWDSIDTNAALKLVEFGENALRESPPDATGAAWSFAGVSQFYLQYGSTEEAERLANKALKALPLADPRPGFQTSPELPYSILLQLESKRGATQEAELAGDKLLNWLLKEGVKAKSHSKHARYLDSLWYESWELLPEASLRKALEAAPRDSEYAQSIFRGLMGLAIARGGNWRDGLASMQAAGPAAELSLEFWSAEIQLAALVGRTDLQRMLAITGLANFASEADAVRAHYLAAPLLTITPDPSWLPILTNLVSKSIEGNIDTVILAKYPLALLNFRSGNFMQAAKVLEDLFQVGPSRIGKLYFDSIKPKAWFLRSAVEMNLGNLNAAVGAYREGLRLHSPALRNPGTAFRGIGWLHACSAELLRREAAKLLGDATPAETTTTNKP